MNCVSTTSATNATNATNEVSPRRFKIYFQDDAVRQRSEETVQQLLSSAMDESITSTSNSALLAKKALKYRKVYDRIAGVDMNSPEFDASTFLGVAWCKTEDLKDHCKRQQEATEIQQEATEIQQEALEV